MCLYSQKIAFSTQDESKKKPMKSGAYLSIYYSQLKIGVKPQQAGLAMMTDRHYSQLKIGVKSDIPALHKL